jgi:ParB/RepB/Spo0J family partition protein
MVPGADPHAGGGGAADRSRILWIPLARIRVTRNVRKSVRGLTDLTRSLAERGMLNPILVRMEDDGWYELIAGHRRAAAARLLGWEAVPARVYRNISEAEVRALRLAENLGRQELTPLEEAEALRDIIARGEARTAREAARVVGMAPLRAEARLRLLDLPDDVRTLLERVDEETGQPLLGVAQALVLVEELDGQPDLQRRFADKAVRYRLSAARLRAWIRQAGEDRRALRGVPLEDAFEIPELEEETPAARGSADPPFAPDAVPAALRRRFLLYGVLRGFNDFDFLRAHDLSPDAVWSAVAALSDADVERWLDVLALRYVTHARRFPLLEAELRALLVALVESNDRDKTQTRSGENGGQR